MISNIRQKITLYTICTPICLDKSNETDSDLPLISLYRNKRWGIIFNSEGVDIDLNIKFSSSPDFTQQIGIHLANLHEFFRINSRAKMHRRVCKIWYKIRFDVHVLNVEKNYILLKNNNLGFGANLNF
jgi:hypothetical protein